MKEPGEHPRVLVSSPSRDPSKSLSIIQQARPKNSTEIYYTWQDNLRGEQGTKCPLCPNLPPDNSVGTGQAAGVRKHVWWRGVGTASKAAVLGTFCSLEETLWQLLMSRWVLEGPGSLGWRSQLQRGRGLFGHPVVAWRLLLHPGHRQQAQIHPKMSR